jgi:hypothetical protein
LSRRLSRLFSVILLAAAVDAIAAFSSRSRRSSSADFSVLAKKALLVLNVRGFSLYKAREGE